MSPQLVDDDGHGAEHLGLARRRHVALVIDENRVQQRRNKVLSYLGEERARLWQSSYWAQAAAKLVPPSVTGDTFPQGVEVPILCLHLKSPRLPL